MVKPIIPIIIIYNNKQYKNKFLNKKEEKKLIA